MSKVIAVANQKGGVGKTTTAVNVTAALGAQKKRVLLVDLDPQGNATSGMGIVKKQTKRTSYHLLIGSAQPSETVIHTPFQNVDIIPGGMELAGAEIEMIDMEDRVYRLKKELAFLKGDYDFVIIDCPPSLGLLTLNAFTGADALLVPIQCEYYALEGLSQLMATVRQVKHLYNSLIELEGVLLTMYDGRLNLTMQVVNEVKKFFPQKVYKTVIPRTVRISEAPSYGQPILYYDRNSKGAQAYDDLAKEIIKANKNFKEA